jgi:hypothetical protein
MIRQVANLKDKAGSEFRAWDRRSSGKLKAGLTVIRTKIKNKANDIKTSVKAPLKKKVTQAVGKTKAVLYGHTRHSAYGKVKGAIQSNQIKIKNKLENTKNLYKGYKKAAIQYGTGQVKGKLIQTGSKIRRELR